jgi:hypothetical protein
MKTIIRILALSLVSTGCTTESGTNTGEITQETPLLHEDGTVAAHGWARGPLMQYDRSLVQEARLDGLREWEYYAVFTPDFAIGLTLADIHLLSFAILTLEDYSTGEIHSAIFIADAAALDFPPTPFGNTHFVAATGSIDYRFEDTQRAITVISGAAGAANRMEAHLQLQDSRATQSIAVVHTFDEPGEFFYENKRVSMPATGSVQVGDVLYELPEGSSFGVLDWGRGAWPSDVHWEWGHFTGTTDGHLVGINLGTVFADDTPGTADAVIVDGVLHKISRSEWDYDLNDLMSPWHFTSTDARIDLTLTPDFDDSTTLSLGPAYTLTRWKVHGEIRGTVQLDDGSQLQVQGVRGAAEYVEIIW